MPSRLSFETCADGGITRSERMRIDSNGLITGTGTSLGAWTAYTPTLGGTGWAIGDGTVLGAYCQIGKVVFFRASVTFGSTSTFGAAAAPTVSLPVAGRTGVAMNYSFSGRCIDTSLSVNYLPAVTAASTTAVQLFSLGTSGATTAFSATSPVTWASTDVFYVNGVYEIA